MCILLPDLDLFTSFPPFLNSFINSEGKLSINCIKYSPAVCIFIYIRLISHKVSL
nr:MAG TPA: hypothetical protein [Caudoviricetes sp.]